MVRNLLLMKEVQSSQGTLRSDELCGTTTTTKRILNTVYLLVIKEKKEQIQKMYTIKSF